MSNKIKILIVIIVLAAVITIAGLVLTGKMRVNITKYISDGEKSCIEADGIFYKGGWGADNCVFPPKEQL